jgi:hypothetical protein
LFVQDDLIFFIGQRVFVDLWVQVEEPALSALMIGPSGTKFATKAHFPAPYFRSFSIAHLLLASSSVVQSYHSLVFLRANGFMVVKNNKARER